MNRIRKTRNLLIGLALLLAGLLAACGDSTSTVVPAAATTTSAAMTTKSTGEAMMAGTPAGAMTTEGAMMAGTSSGVMTTGGVMMAGTPAAMSMVSSTGTFDHMSGPKSVSGKVQLVADSTGKHYTLNISGLQVTGSGTALHLWYSKEADPMKLTTAAQVKSGIDLGSLKATSGDLSYMIDQSIDVHQYMSVVIFDNATDSVFGVAPLGKGQ